MKKIKILFVCLGNICRSPAAQGVMQRLVDERGVSEKFEIDSAGTYSGHRGQLPDPRGLGRRSASRHRHRGALHQLPSRNRTDVSGLRHVLLPRSKDVPHHMGVGNCPHPARRHRRKLGEAEEWTDPVF